MVFGCRSSWLVWNLCLGWLGLVLVAPQDSYSHLLQFNICNASESVNLVLGSVWIVVVREIWCHRNKVISKVVWWITMKFSLWLNWRLGLGSLLKFSLLSSRFQIGVLTPWYVYIRYSLLVSYWLTGYCCWGFWVFGCSLVVISVCCWFWGDESLVLSSSASLLFGVCFGFSGLGGFSWCSRISC